MTKAAKGESKALTTRPKRDAKAPKPSPYTVSVADKPGDD